MTIEIERKIAKKIGISEKTLYEMKKDRGLIRKHKYTAEEKQQLIERYDEIQQKHPALSEKDTPKKRWFRKVKSSNYEECLDKIFWAGNAELIKLKKPNFFTGLFYNMYSENAKMFEGMLKPRDQLLAEIFYATLKPGRRGQVDTGVLMEIVMGRPRRELRAAISKYNRLYINRHNNSNEPQLLVELKNISRN
uniref:HTH psq-type domain-containing protein n=1 Tax=Globodera pallida TaxID=36090 RepID=A0A183C4S4_GLOPA